MATVYGNKVNGVHRAYLTYSISSSSTKTTVTVSAGLNVLDGQGTKREFDIELTATGQSKKTGHLAHSDSYRKGSTKMVSATYTYTRGTSDANKTLKAVLDCATLSEDSTVSKSIEIPALTSYTVSYNANGGSGAPGSQTKYYGKSLTLSSTRPTRTGYTFNGWATSASGSVAYQPGSTYTSNASATLYAKWTPINCTLTYNDNGGSGGPGTQSATYNQPWTLSTVQPIRENYIFLGWADSASATTPKYGTVLNGSSATITITGAKTIYAVWRYKYLPPAVTNPYTFRSDENGENEDEGTEYFVCRFSFEPARQYKIVNKSLVTEYITDSNSHYQIGYKRADGTGTETFTDVYDASLATLVSRVVTASPNIEVEYKYDILIYYWGPYQSGRINTQYAKDYIAEAFYPMDVNADGTAISFFSAATDDNWVDPNDHSRGKRNLLSVSGDIGIDDPILEAELTEILGDISW